MDIRMRRMLLYNMQKIYYVMVPCVHMVVIVCKNAQRHCAMCTYENPGAHMHMDAWHEIACIQKESMGML
jgi:hypothetical protein